MPAGADAIVLLDTSAAVAAMNVDHPAHAETRAAFAGRRLGLAGHAWFEAFSVLTRLPPPARRSPQAVSRVLLENFPETRFLDVDAQGALRAALGEAGIAGGSVYDALVGATAASHGLPLLTRDGRASAVYRAVGADVELVT